MVYVFANGRSNQSCEQLHFNPTNLDEELKMPEMNAAVLRSSDPIGVESVELTEPRAGEVLIKIAACGVCHSDLHWINNFRNNTLPAGIVPPKAAILGHEVAGIVEEIGPGVTAVAPGDHVIVGFRPNCGGNCFYCINGTPWLCERPDNPDRAYTGEQPRLSQDGVPIMQGVGVAGFSEYTVMPERAAIKIRNDAPLETVCLIGCAVTTGVGAVINTAKIQSGSDIAVIGMGGVGLNIVQGARLAGARRIIAIDTMDNKLDMAANFGATHFVNASEGDPVEKARGFANGYIDYAFEAIGLGATCRQAFDMVRDGGTAVVVGVVGQDITVPGRAFLREKKLIGSFYGSNSLQRDIPKLVDLYMDGKIMVDELISKRRPLTEINEAFDDMLAGEVARSVLHPAGI